MGRIVAIDYGGKRVGVAATDPLKLIAGGVGTVATSEILSFLIEYVRREEVERFVVGLPKQMNNLPSENMKRTEKFVETLKKTFPTIPVVFSDERFTSRLAHRTMLEGGLKKKERQNKALVDEISAVIILQTYMEFNH